MAEYRPKVPAPLKRQLIEQAGNKCANPGCPNILLELHHIREWHVYKTHDGDHMIALCPTCHASVTRGPLRITDEDVYAWKGIERRMPRVGHVFVQPGGEPPRLLLGTVSAVGDDGLVVFDFGIGHKLSFAVRDGDIMLLNLKILSAAKVLVDVVDGYVRTADEHVKICSRPGHIKIPAGIHSAFVPEWIRTRLLAEDKYYGLDGMPLLEIKVVQPGLVRVNGIWTGQDEAVVITDRRLSFVRRSLLAPITLLGDRDDPPILHYSGPVDEALFQL
jgi:hypothetical protein